MRLSVSPRTPTIGSPRARFALCFSSQQPNGCHIDDPDVKLGDTFSHMHLNAWELRTNRTVPGLESQVREALAQVNPNLTVIDFQTFGEQVQENFNQQAMVADLTSVFGLLALVLASIGLYGVTAYAVARRTGEIGIRMALGADRMDVLRLVLRGAFLLVGVGLAIGIVFTMLVGRFMASQLFGVKAYDPAILLITTLILRSSGAGCVGYPCPARGQHRADAGVEDGVKTQSLGHLFQRLMMQLDELVCLQ